MTRPPKEKSIELLERAAERVGQIHSEGFVPVYDAEIWIRDTKLALSNIFGEMSQQMEDFQVALTPFTTLPESIPEKGKYFKTIAPNLSGLLQSMAREVRDYRPDDPKTAQVPDPAGPRHDPAGKDIFIIHGRDDATKDAVARLLSKGKLNPIILHEQPNRGRSVIEKFEDYASVTYAVALLTDDDVGALKTEPHNLRPRPRQNVLFEFGYFIGKLGRERVCGLVKGGVEIPSDYSGVLLISLDREDWRMELLRELRDAELPIDIGAAL